MSAPTPHDTTAQLTDTTAPARTPLDVESEAFAVAIAVAIVNAVVGGVLFAGTNPPIWGGISLGVASAGSILIAGVIVAYVGYWRSRSVAGQQWRLELKSWKFIVDATSVALVHAVLAVLASIATFLLLQRSFQGVTLDAPFTTIAMATVTALAAYWIYLSVSSITTPKLSSLLVLFMTFGTITAMATASDPAWWEYHFSQLGTFGDRSSALFNLTLIIAGFLVTTFALYLQRDLQLLVDRGVLVKPSAPRTVSIIFVIMGVMLSCVGIFPLTVSILLHNLSASGMAVTFLVLLFASPWLLKGLPRRFFLVSFGFAAALIIGAVLFYPVQYYNLTAFELVAFAIIFAWIAVFIRYISALTDQTAPDAAPTPAAAAA
ncbi:DUF998 domain-containing protein [Microcella sp.]|uniref:DUF998 domain-containing protein n=1 Tax=Microcella sp. TaxID=1913979 RepID=UPI003F6F876E